MSRDVDQVTRELEHEKRARQRAATDAQTQRRMAKALEFLLTGATRSENLAELLHETLTMLIEAVAADVGVVRLRDGDLLRSTATVGLEDEIRAEFSPPIDASIAQHMSALFVSNVPSDSPCRSDAIREKQVRALYSLPLVEGEHLVGALYLGMLSDRELSNEDKEFLAALGPRIASVITRQTTREALELAVRSRDEVLSVVAHDLQNPLNVISIAANVLLQRLQDLSIRRPIERIIRSAQRAERLVRDLLEINAIETGRFSIERQRVESADLILSALESQQNLAADASVIIAADLSPELLPIDGDEERLLEVLENLIGNAVKFTASGGSITVGAANQGNEIRIWVKDSGAGISPEQMPHIFDRFWQARKAERRGTGLGLTICKAIIEAHGGRIWCESKLGEGTTMHFTLPTSPNRTTMDSVAEVANILMVDDRPENLLSLQAILQRPDYRLHIASSGEEALRLALRERFAVALIDVAMPGMNGFEVAVHLKELERSRDIPIIFITAFGDDPQEIHRAYSAGGADYLVKPLDTEIVRKKVAVFVDLSRKRHLSERPRREHPR